MCGNLFKFTARFFGAPLNSFRSSGHVQSGNVGVINIYSPLITRDTKSVASVPSKMIGV